MNEDIDEAVSRKLYSDKTEKNIGDATLQGLQVRATRDQTKETKRLSTESNRLQSKIYWLTVAIVILTVTLVMIGIIQLLKI